MTVANEFVVVGPRPLRGRVRIPGDKGISHRALIAAALADGVSTIAHLGPGDDVVRTRHALAALGVTMTVDGGTLEVTGRGVEALHEPANDIDCGNSGTTMRMLAGLLAGRPFPSVLIGDDSLSQRPMQRVIAPLRVLGADIDGRGDGGVAPLVIRGGPLVGTRVELEVASGQVKTALVLAGLQASGTTEIVEPAASRDHTERLFSALGAPIERIDERTIRVHAGAPDPFTADVPGDPSSAAFFVVAATITPGSEIVIEDVLLNPGRLEFVEVLRAMGADISVVSDGDHLGEPVGSIKVRATDLHAASFKCSEPIIDEVPVLAVAAAFADGATEITNAAELRVKESNRITTVEQELTKLGVRVDATADGLLVHGGRPHAATCTSHGDHRVAMAIAVAGNALEGESHIQEWGSVAVSYPEFAQDLERLTVAK
ncbi:MAG: 3-phosphoshikimate 1-carboxyvinyltransferase [Acidimicrobiia bacterium]|nr:3-phosphoshikimate 1-carboxyvinyltransferase [Acidimicrobiia bacterium]